MHKVIFYSSCWSTWQMCNNITTKTTMKALSIKQIKRNFKSKRWKLCCGQIIKEYYLNDLWKEGAELQGEALWIQLIYVPFINTESLSPGLDVTRQVKARPPGLNFLVINFFILKRDIGKTGLFYFYFILQNWKTGPFFLVFLNR